jgi:hypothetical protein
MELIRKVLGQQEIAVVKPREESIIVKRETFPIKLDNKKVITISGKEHKVDPRQLIRMIKNITQTIGEYKSQDNPYSAYVTSALRKARNDIASDLENSFSIHFSIDENTGKSQFTLG